MKLHDKKIKKSKPLKLKFPDEEKYWNIDCISVIFEIIWKNFRYRIFTIEQLQKFVKFVDFEHSGEYHLRKMKEQNYLINMPSAVYDYKSDNAYCFYFWNKRYKLNRQVKWSSIEQLKKETFFLKLLNKGKN